MKASTTRQYERKRCETLQSEKIRVYCKTCGHNEYTSEYRLGNTYPLPVDIVCSVCSESCSTKLFDQQTFEKDVPRKN